MNMEFKKNPFEAHIWIKDFQADKPVKGVYLVKTKKTGVTKKGDPYLSITLGDRTGEVEARVWERTAEFAPLFNEGDIVEIKGLTSLFRNQIQVTLSDLKTVQAAFQPDLFLEHTKENIPAMMENIKNILSKMQNHHLRTLVQRFLTDKPFMDLFGNAPAAKNFHHAYLGGLLEHTLAVCRLAVTLSDQYPQLDRDLLITGAFLHDIGKIRELEYGRQIDYSDQGRLLGHLVLGVQYLEEKLAEIKGFPSDLAFRLKHLILSHHGQFEFGSPKRPKFLEAFALNLIDDLDAKINGLSHFIEKDKQEGVWTDFNRLFERFLLKGKIGIPEEKEIQTHPSEDPQKRLF